MSLHLYKLLPEHSDLFISKIDLEENEIAYSVRDKAAGKLMEPPHISKFTLGDNVTFDKRFIPMNTFLGIFNTLHELPEVN